MGEAARLDDVFEAFINGTVDFAQFRAVVEEQLASSPELSGAALQRLDALRRANRMSAALHSVMVSEIERGSGGDIPPPFRDAPAEPPAADAGVAASPQEDAKSLAQIAPADPARTRAAPGAATPPGIGTVLAGRYRLEALLGRGGMNLVYRADDLRQAVDGPGPARVAVKLLAPEYAGREARRVLEWEASVLSGLTHPGVVRVLDFHHDREHPFLVMELLAGERLRARLVRFSPASLPMDEAMQIGRELAETLAYIHRQGYVHRDLKPANIFLTDAGHVRLVDFGLAAPIGGGAESLAPPVRPGTPLYASPQMLEGGEPDPRDDVYSLGCVVYEMLAGRHPWDGLPADEAEHRKLRLTRPQGLPEARWAVLRSALAFSAADRPGDAAAFKSAFFPSPRKRWILPWAGAAVLAAVAIGVALMVLGPGPQPRQPAGTRPAPAPQESPRVEESLQPDVEPARGAAEALAPVDESAEEPAGEPAERPAVGAPPGEPAEEPAEEPIEEPADERQRPAGVPEVSPPPVIEPEQERVSESEAEAAAVRATRPAPPALAFTASRYTIPKSGVALRLELRRPANYQGPLRVRWRTVDGTALNDVDFAGSAQWRLAEAESDAPSIVIFIPIVQKWIPGPSRSFLIELDEIPGGPPVGFPSRAEVTIIDR
jgi:hypothetical protein